MPDIALGAHGDHYLTMHVTRSGEILGKASTA
jgi:hypothetical protein